MEKLCINYLKYVLQPNKFFYHIFLSLFFLVPNLFIRKKILTKIIFNYINKI